MDEEVFQNISEAMLMRSRDKLPSVRVQAVLALARLQDAGNPNCQIAQGELIF